MKKELITIKDPLDTHYFAPIERKQVNNVSNVEKKKNASNQETKYGDKHHESYATQKRQQKQTQSDCARST